MNLGERAVTFLDTANAHHEQVPDCLVVIDPTAEIIYE